jgi:hypothetical protein
VSKDRWRENEASGSVWLLAGGRRKVQVERNEVAQNLGFHTKKSGLTLYSRGQEKSMASFVV